MSDADRPLVWLRGVVASPPFSDTTRRQAGSLLRMLQRGEKLSMPQSRPMPTIGRRCHELRIRDENQTWRIVYRVDEDAPTRRRTVCHGAEGGSPHPVKRFEARLSHGGLRKGAGMDYTLRREPQ
jgi:hypothetical protein